MVPTGFDTWGPDQIEALAAAYRGLIDRIMPPVTQSVDGVHLLTPVQ
jgi:hypothetical protein